MIRGREKSRLSRWITSKRGGSQLVGFEEGKVSSR